MGFTRLSINDISSNGNQPLIKNDNYYLICNGEIYNHKNYNKKMNFKLNLIVTVKLLFNV